ncbi:hypothetical protein TRFO_22682 [Tritrichomonas foetus]|uniref:Uncharacterized protein n=1 Tax=Tritrichomonas foetus TaxID=1144522 RepID=A0A1J4KC14_9EUKA|nr:hypothetical protein TRFO_22682 [Tritrichomonas foetus]|eukprot:OHT08763.1 hypothetical protein TRFO_22682 [Tritrichomonas foetus]
MMQQTPNLFRSCVITGSTFGIGHLIHGIIVYFLLIGIATISTLTFFCVFIFIIISVVFFIVGCRRLCSLEKEQCPFVIASAVLSLFASAACFCVNIEWLENSHPINRVPFFLLIVASLYLSFTIFLVTLFGFLKFTGVFTLFQDHGVILGKIVCDLLVSLLLSFTFGFTDVEDHKNSRIALIVICLFAVVPFITYTIIGCLLECYVNRINNIAGPLDQI